MEYRIIKSNIDNSKVNNEILNSVIGQMSDGIWENSSRLQGFWRFAEISDDNNILIEDRYYYIHGDSCTRNPYINMTDKEIRKWFNEAYLIMVDALHLKPETEEECDTRLKDGVNTPFTEIDEENEYII